MEIVYEIIGFILFVLIHAGLLTFFINLIKEGPPTFK